MGQLAVIEIFYPRLLLHFLALSRTKLLESNIQKDVIDPIFLIQHDVILFGKAEKFYFYEISKKYASQVFKIKEISPKLMYVLWSEKAHIHYTTQIIKKPCSQGLDTAFLKLGHLYCFCLFQFANFCKNRYEGICSLKLSGNVAYISINNI